MKRIILILLTLILITGCGKCVEKNNFECCKGLECSAVSVECEIGTEAEFKGCNNKCLPAWDCKSIEGCYEEDQSCCNGDDCAQVAIECGPDDKPIFEGCDETCNPIVSCVTA